MHTLDPKAASDSQRLQQLETLVQMLERTAFIGVWVLFVLVLKLEWFC